MKKRTIIVVAAMTALAGLVSIYLYLNQPHRSVRSEEAISLSADSLFRAFLENESAANALYLNNVLDISGKIKSIEKNTEGKTVIVLETGDMMFGINCTMDGEFNLKEGDNVTVKGICTGYLADVVITQSVIEEK
jgi:tRNA_anti-like